MDHFTGTQIKDWLASTGHDRTWLASQCHVSKSTVDGWLSAGRSIPKPAFSILKTLMGGRTTINPALVLTVFLKAQQIAESKNMTLDQWIEDLIEREVEQYQTGIVPINPIGESPLQSLPPPQAVIPKGNGA